MTVSAQLADARVPARMIHNGRSWGMRNTAPAERVTQKQNGNVPWQP